MVIRTWMAHTSPDRESEYAAIVRKVVLPHFKTVPGYLGSKFLRRPVDGEVEGIAVVRNSMGSCCVQGLDAGSHEYLEEAGLPHRITGKFQGTK